jgi:hypothetical protein
LPTVRAKQKVYAYRRWLCEEIVRNKFCSNYNHSCTWTRLVCSKMNLTIL